MKHLQAAAFVLLAFGGTANAQSDADWVKVIEAARKEGKVVWYTGQTANPSHKEFIRTFEAKYGVRVELLDGRTTEIRERVRSEHAAGRTSGDVYHDGRTAMALMRQEGLLQPLSASCQMRKTWSRRMQSTTSPFRPTTSATASWSTAT